MSLRKDIYEQNSVTPNPKENPKQPLDTGVLIEHVLLHVMEYSVKLIEPAGADAPGFRVLPSMPIGKLVSAGCRATLVLEVMRK